MKVLTTPAALASVSFPLVPVTFSIPAMEVKPEAVPAPRSTVTAAGEPAYVRESTPAPRSAVNDSTPTMALPATGDSVVPVKTAASVLAAADPRMFIVSTPAPPLTVSAPWPNV
jgi:hypothetical protein